MANNLIDNDSFEFVEGTEKTKYDSFVRLISYQPSLPNTSYIETINTAGYINTLDAQNDAINFCLPLSYAILNTNTITVLDASIKVMQNGNYILGSASAYADVTSDINIAERSALKINVFVEHDFTGVSITKLDPVAIQFKLTFTVGTA